MKRKCAQFIKNAEELGETEEVAEFQEQLERIESMIEQSGGDPDA